MTGRASLYAPRQRSRAIFERINAVAPPRHSAAERRRIREVLAVKQARPAMDRCIFCETVLTPNRANQPARPSDRSKEHVLRRDWLKKLGHSQTEMPSALMQAGDVLSRRNPTAESIQAGEVCNQCNTTWMNDLDLSVEGVILDFARNPGGKISVDPVTADRLGSWILKTACTYVATDQAHRRRISRSILANVHREGFLPDGFIAFGKRNSQLNRDAP